MTRPIVIRISVVGKRQRGSSESYQNGKRGRHKARGSHETRRWEDEHLIPKRPPWMPQHVYTELSRLRGSL